MFQFPGPPPSKRPIITLLLALARGQELTSRGAGSQKVTGSYRLIISGTYFPPSTELMFFPRIQMMPQHNNYSCSLLLVQMA